MKRFFNVLVITISAAIMMSMMPVDEIMTIEDGVTVVNTTTLCAKVSGYTQGQPVPLKIYIKDGKILKVKPLRNKETPKYFALIKKEMLPRWEGMTTKKAATAKVDCVTGATISSKAVMKNVQKGCEYYNQNKK